MTNAFGTKQDENGTLYHQVELPVWNNQLDSFGRSATTLQRATMKQPTGDFTFKFDHTWIGHYNDLEHPTPVPCMVSTCTVCAHERMPGVNTTTNLEDDNDN